MNVGVATKNRTCWSIAWALTLVGAHLAPQPGPGRRPHGRAGVPRSGRRFGVGGWRLGLGDVGMAASCGVGRSRVGGPRAAAGAGRGGQHRAPGTSRLAPCGQRRAASQAAEATPPMATGRRGFPGGGWRPGRLGLSAAVAPRTTPVSPAGMGTAGSRWTVVEPGGIGPAACWWPAGWSGTSSMVRY
jgi:hypothetical protein